MLCQDINLQSSLCSAQLGVSLAHPSYSFNVNIKIEKYAGNNIHYSSQVWGQI